MKHPTLSMRRRPARMLPLVCLVAAAAASMAASLAWAQAAPAAAASAPDGVKDIVLDKPEQAATPAVKPTAGRLVPTPEPGRASRPARPAPTAAQDVATASALAELGLDLLRQAGNGKGNAVVSPLSLAATLGMLHAGTSGAGARELASLLGTPAFGERFYATRLPGLLDRLAAPEEGGGPFVMANRVWVDKGTVAEIAPAYAAKVADRFNSDGALLSFREAPAARQAINGWVAQKTAGRIPELLPEGSVTPTTRLVVTNAVHFKSRWEAPFDPAKTQTRPFQTQAGARPVPTMIDERQVRQAVVDQLTVMEIPFAGNAYSLVLAMPPAGQPLAKAEADLEGVELAAWSAQLKPRQCQLELPKFSIAPQARPLKPALEELGVRTIFSADADFTGMLGKTGTSVHVDDVFQAAMIVIDELGGEAAAATGATVQAKSFAMPAAPCAVDRPFVFAIVHKASGAPLFVGRVTDPASN